MSRKKENETRREMRKEVFLSAASKAKNLRKMRGLTTESFSWSLGLNDKFVSACEVGRKLFPIETIFLMAQFYDIELEFFLNPNLTFDDWFDEARRADLGIRRFSETPNPFIVYEVPLKY